MSYIQGSNPGEHTTLFLQKVASQRLLRFSMQTIKTIAAPTRAITSMIISSDRIGGGSVVVCIVLVVVVETVVGVVEVVVVVVDVVVMMTSGVTVTITSSEAEWPLESYTTSVKL